tara:strand:+ start:7041 stop:8069 length:1029 start_codon:yes stop_codon:yes gene_type:complete
MIIDPSSFTFFVLVIIIALVFELSNGFNDAANAIATVVSTRVMSPFQAVLMAAIMNFVGAITGTAVAKTVGKGVVDPGALSGEFGMLTVGAGVLAAALWVFTATRFGMPVSGSHSLVSGVAGAGIAHAGWGILVGAGIQKIGLGLIFSPILGFLFGYIIMLAIYWIFQKATPTLVSALFGKLQIGTAAAMAFSHGSNDAQKTMGIITLALSVYYDWEIKGIPFEVPMWVIIVSGVVMGIGTYLGGRRVIHTLGVRIVTMRSPHGFSAEAAAASVIEFASRTGIPVSTTHVITSSILGMGSTRRISAVRWGVAREIVYGWVLTFPIVGILAFTLYKILKLIMI